MSGERGGGFFLYSRMNDAEVLLETIKSRTREFTGDVLVSLKDASDRLLTEDLAWSIWVSFRKKTGMVCISINLYSDNARNLIIYLHTYLFRYLSDRIQDTAQDGDDLFIKDGYQITARYWEGHGTTAIHIGERTRKVRVIKTEDMFRVVKTANRNPQDQVDPAGKENL
jgi:hypothetical protein